MTENDVLEGISEIIREVVGTPASEIVPSASFQDDLDVDSLSMVEIAVAAEDKFGIRIPDSEVAKLKTVGDAVRCVLAAGVPA
ncbi:MAG TPA: acyl carrier protein [Mycobacteriales bacterium]|nr:acyl carrier protein [Mycobacteriales bacterium]